MTLDVEQVRSQPRNDRVSPSRQPAHPGGPCPAAESIVRFVIGALDQDERADVEAHLADCEGCYIEAVALREALEATLGPKVEGSRHAPGQL